MAFIASFTVARIFFDRFFKSSWSSKWLTSSWLAQLWCLRWQSDYGCHQKREWTEHYPPHLKIQSWKDIEKTSTFNDFSLCFLGFWAKKPRIPQHKNLKTQGKFIESWWLFFISFRHLLNCEGPYVLTITSKKMSGSLFWPPRKYFQFFSIFFFTFIMSIRQNYTFYV